MNLILKIFVVFITIGLVAAGGYYFYWRVYNPQNGEQAQDLTGVKPELLVSESVISPILSFNAEKVWFMTTDGRMYRQAIGGGEKEELPLPEAIVSPLEIIWQHRGSDFVVRQNINGHIRYKLYDAEEQVFVAYPEQLRSPVFLVGDEKIVYDWSAATSSAHELKIADSRSENFRKVMDLGPANYELAASPARQEVVLYVTSGEPAKLLFVNMDTGRSNEIGESPRNYDGVQFSPDGRFILESRQDGSGNPKLFVYNLDTSREVDLQITASTKQVVWKPDSAAIILGSESGFSRYDLSTARWQDIYQFESRGQYNPTQILLHPEESILFFVDEKTGFLYRLDY